LALNDSASIPAILARHAAAHGRETILRKKDRGIWKPVTWTELSDHVGLVRAGLHQAGFTSGEVAGILSHTRPEAAYADLAILSAGGTSLAIHPDEEPEQLAQILRSTNCSLLFVENEEQLDKALTVRGNCPALRRIVIFDMKGLRDLADPQCSSLASFHGSGQAPETPIDPGARALILVALGDKVGKPRSLTHGDIMRILKNTSSFLELRPGDERLAVLPMSTLTEHVLGLYLSLQGRTITNYLESPDTAMENLQEVQPTVFGADAPTWSHLHERVARAASAATRVQGALYQWALAAAKKGGTSARLARLLALNAVRRELGLNRLRLAYVCGAPVRPDVLAWAEALGIRIERVDRPALRDATADARSLAVMEEAYSGS
jgi:long-chain acyl-CoA synthetase